MKEIRGVCFLHSETRTEGGWWAVQEDGFETDSGHWKYEWLKYLENGDEFTVYNEDGSIVWSGIIIKTTGLGPSLTVLRRGKVVRIRGWKQQVVGGW